MTRKTITIYMNAVTLGICACLIICFDHENSKIVIKVPEVHDKENNYNLYECCHSRHLFLRFEIWDMRFEIWDLEFEIWDLRFEIWDLIFKELRFGCILSKCISSKWILSKCILSKCHLSKCIFSKCISSKWISSKCILSKRHFVKVHFAMVHFVKVHFVKVHFGVTNSFVVVMWSAVNKTTWV